MMPTCKKLFQEATRARAAHFRVRSMVRGDIPAVLAIGRRRCPALGVMLETLLAQRRLVPKVAELGTTIGGYVVCVPEPGSPVTHCEIITLVVAPGFAGLGIAALLVGSVLRAAPCRVRRHIDTIIPDFNTAASNCVRGLGFKAVQVLRADGAPGGDWYRFRLVIPPGERIAP